MKPADIWKHYEYLQTRPNKRREGGLSASVLNFHVYSMRTFFAWLENLEAIAINPMTGLEFPRQFSKARTALSQEEIKRLFAVARTNKEKAILSVFYALGLRRSEAEDLNVTDFDFSGKKVVIRAGKFGKRRELPLHEKAIEMIQEYIQTDRRNFIIAKTPSDHRALFYSSIGTRFTGAKMNDVIKHLADKAQIVNPVSLHVLRHSVATHLKENGMAMEQIKDFLGHSSLDVTQNYLNGYGWKWNQKQRNKAWKDEEL